MTGQSNGRVGEIVVTGSLAYDLIMDFPGNFKDHILPDKMHVINLSFLVGELKKQRGGCAANIAYTLSLLGISPRIVAAAGADFAEYREWLRERGIEVDGIHLFEGEVTASCYITTDRADNQITGFHPGAMKRAAEISLKDNAGKGKMVIVSPDDPAAMLRHCREAREAGLDLVFDPSFQVIALDGEQLMEGARGARVLILNDYEFAVFQEKTGKSRDELLRDVQMIVVTLGEKGSEIWTSAEQPVRVPAARPVEVRDPTGAGDAYRGGFLAGLTRGLPLDVCGRMGALAAVYCIEQYGTSNHAYTRDEFAARFEENFGASLVR